MSAIPVLARHTADCKNNKKVKTIKRDLDISFLINKQKIKRFINMPSEMNTKQITKAHMLTEMRSKGFSPNKFITLLGHQYSSLNDVEGAYAHTINVLQRKIYGRYGKKIKHMAVAETGHQHFDVGKGSHIHALIECDEDWLEMDKWQDAIKRTWMKTKYGTSISLVDDAAAANETWFMDVGELEGRVGYCYKNSNDAERYQFIDRNY